MYNIKSKYKCYIFNHFQDIHENTHVGTKIKLNFNDNKVQDIIAYALLSVDQQKGSEKSYVLSKIINASKQVN